MINRKKNNVFYGKNINNYKYYIEKRLVGYVKLILFIFYL